MTAQSASSRAGRRGRDRLAERVRGPRLVRRGARRPARHGLGRARRARLNGQPRDLLEGRLGRADVWWVTGDNQFHLAQSIARAGLSQAFPRLLREKVYVGTSAGSMIFSRRFDERAPDLLGDLADLHLLGEERIKPACPLFDWYVKPHLGSRPCQTATRHGRTDLRRAWTSRSTCSTTSDPVVRGDEVDVVSTGRWRLVGR
jgi:dipeptidase E